MSRVTYFILQAHTGNCFNKVIIINIFLKHKILSEETILSAYMHAHVHTHTYTHTHTGICTHKHTDYTKLNLHNLKWAANRFLTDEDSSTECKR